MGSEGSDRHRNKGILNRTVGRIVGQPVSLIGREMTRIAKSDKGKDRKR